MLKIEYGTIIPIYMIQTNIDFFCVSLKENIPTINESIHRWSQFYENISYTIICPSVDREIFTREIIKYRCPIQIINEEDLLTFGEFLSICKDIFPNIESDEKSFNRIGWYYQQALKILFPLSRISTKSFRLVMWDADTLPLKKINFFREDYSLLYGSLSENHQPYFQTLKALFKTDINSKYGFTTQFFTCTSKEVKNLYGILNRYIPQKNLPLNTWVCQLILKSVKEAHNTLFFSMFSEQELFGFSNKIGSSIRQIPITYFRHTLNAPLSKLQEKILTRMGFVHLTYERRNNFNCKSVSSIIFTVIITYHFLNQNSRRHKITKSFFELAMYVYSKTVWELQINTRRLISFLKRNFF